jgi:hypothetical protein
MFIYRRDINFVYTSAGMQFLMPFMQNPLCMRREGVSCCVLPFPFIVSYIPGLDGSTVCALSLPLLVCLRGLALLVLVSQFSRPFFGLVKGTTTCLIKCLLIHEVFVLKIIIYYV